MQIKLVSHVLFYMDDILLIGSRVADVLSALRKAAAWAHKELGVKLHDGYQVLNLARSRIDMMGYVVGYECSTIRARIFLRARRNFIRAGIWLRHNHRLTLRRAQSVISYYGYFKHTDAVHVSAKLDTIRIFEKAKKDVSFYSKMRIAQKGRCAA